jgi:hypothetical protein
MLFRLGARGFCLLIAVLGLFGAVDEFQHAREEKAYRAHGETVKTESVTLRDVQVKGRRGQPSGVTYYADITFTTRSGQQVFQGDIPVPPLLLDTLRANQHVDVQYLPEKPQTVRLADANPLDPSPWSAVLLFLAGSAGFYLITRSRR